MVNIFRKYNHSLLHSKDTSFEGVGVTNPGQKSIPRSPVSSEEIASLQRVLRASAKQFLSVQCFSHTDAALFLLEHDSTP